MSCRAPVPNSFLFLFLSPSLLRRIPLFLLSFRFVAVDLATLLLPVLHVLFLLVLLPPASPLLPLLFFLLMKHSQPSEGGAILPSLRPSIQSWLHRQEMLSPLIQPAVLA